MKILYYIHSLSVGGAETIVAYNLLKLKEKDNNVVLVVDEIKHTFLESKLKKAGIRIISLWPEYSSSYFKRIVNSIKIRTMNYKKEWAYIFEDEKPDVVHIHTFLDRFEIGTYEINKVFYTFHSDFKRNMELGSALHRAKLIEYSNRGMTLFALSSKMKSDIKKVIDLAKVRVIPNGLNLVEIQSNKIDRDTFEKENNIPEGSFIVGHVGRFNEIKNHSKLFEVFSCIREKNKNAYLILIGTGNEEERKKIDDLIDFYNIKKYVRLLGVRENASAIMSVFDVLLLTSKSESFSLVLIEAQVQGVRCVTSDVVPEEVICTNKCFALNINESSRKWAELALDSNVRKQNIRNLNIFSIDNIINITVEAYCESFGNGV